MKSFIKNGIGKVVTDYGTRVMDILSKGRLGQSIFTFFGIVKADALQLPEKGAPGTPAANKGGVIYVKSDGKPYFKSSTTSESDLTQGGGGGTSEKIHLQVRNDEGATIPAGAPLYSRGEIGGSDRILVGICDADSAAKMPCIGIAEAEMNTTSTKDNFAITHGVYNTNISGFTGLAVGDNLYVDPSGSAPHLTQIKPAGLSFIQNVGIVLKTNGTICQGLQVSAIGRTNDTPNLSSGRIFYGDSNNQARSTLLSTLLPPDLTVDGAGTVHANNITGVDVVTSGEWRGTAIASAYLDSDTAHLSGTQTFTGDKTFSGNLACADLDITGSSNALTVNSTTGNIAINASSTDADCMIKVQDNSTAGTNAMGMVATGDDLVMRNDEGDFKVKVANNALEGLRLDQSGNLYLAGNIIPNMSVIKILPSDFIPDDGGRPAMIDDTTSDRWLESHGTLKLFASVEIPMGFKATLVNISGSGNSSVTVYEANINSSTVTSKGTGNIGTQIDITDVTADATNYILIQLAQASGEKVYGGRLIITKI